MAGEWDEWAVHEDLYMVVCHVKSSRLVEEGEVFSAGVPPYCHAQLSIRYLR